MLQQLISDTKGFGYKEIRLESAKFMDKAFHLCLKIRI